MHSRLPPAPTGRAGQTKGRVRGLAAPAVAALALGGCGHSATAANGVQGKSPLQIVAAASASAKRAASVRVTGSILGQGKPISLDMELVSEKGGYGQVRLGESSVQLVGLDGYLYVKGNGPFDERLTGAAAARRLHGAWLEGKADSPPLRSLAALTELSSFLGGTLSDHNGPLRRVPAKRVGGGPAVGVSDPAAGATMYVAATGIPYPLAIVWSGARHGMLSFERWDAPAEPEAPSHAINIKQLQGQG